MHMSFNQLQVTGAQPSQGKMFIFSEKFYEIIPHICAYTCRFNVDLYKKEIFMILGIHLPVEIERSAKKRQSEFIAGRYVAKKAILKSRLVKDNNFNLPIGKHRIPIWPDGVIGSITHTNNTAICAVASKNKYHRLGIDLEPVMTEKLAFELEVLLLDDLEKRLLLNEGFSLAFLVTLAFSTKESFFKAIYPDIKHYFDFDKVKIVSVCLNKGIITLEPIPSFVSKYQLNSCYTCYFNLDNRSVFTLVAFKP